MERWKLSDTYYTDSVSDKLSGDDDEKELETNGKGLLVKERASYIPPKIYCRRCENGFHNIAENDQRCLGSRKKGRSDCQCACQTHYVGRDGKLRKYGVPDDSFTKNDELKIDHSMDAEIEKLTARWHEINGTTPKQEPKKEVIL
jgi:hypothetical protein